MFDGVKTNSAAPIRDCALGTRRVPSLVATSWATGAGSLACPALRPYHAHWHFKRLRCSKIAQSAGTEAWLRLLGGQDALLLCGRLWCLPNAAADCSQPGTHCIAVGAVPTLDVNTPADFTAVLAEQCDPVGALVRMRARPATRTHACKRTHRCFDRPRCGPAAIYTACHAAGFEHPADMSSQASTSMPGRARAAASLRLRRRLPREIFSGAPHAAHAWRPEHQRATQGQVLAAPLYVGFN